MSSFSVAVYQRKLGNTIALTTLGLGTSTRAHSAQSIPKAEEKLRDDLRKAVEATRPVDVGRFGLKRGTRLERVRITITLKDAKRRKVSGLCPIIVEPHHAGGSRPFVIAYHPLRQAEWFPRVEPLADAAATYFAQAWADLDDDAIDDLWSNTKDSLKIVSFNARPKTLLGELPSRQKGVWDDLETDPTRAEKKRRDGLKVLPGLGTDLTVPGTIDALPRAPYRERLQVLLGGSRRQSTLVVGPPGCGKTTLIRQLVVDLLTNDGYATHRNLDEVTHVWRVPGKQLIAGMSRVGEWEERCVEVLEDVRGRRIILYVPDIHLFGRIGRARDSDRALSDFFRGPLSRHEIVIVGECTPEQLGRLEEDDPSFASHFVRMHVTPANRTETFRMMLARARELEAETPIRIEPLAFDTILQLGDALFPHHALPGKAVDLLARLARIEGSESVGPEQVIEHLARDTGLPWVLLAQNEPLGVEAIAEELERRVIGQPSAVREVADLVVRIRSGLGDPRRPYGVYLFTGPTGTGKTELAKALADYLYSSRLLRFDMSEFSGPDAVARLIGDAWNPEGVLTSAAMAQPFSVVLLDEIEKAHPAVLNLLLQVFDDARLTDAAGNTASFTQAVIVMTSNLGARQRPPIGFDEAPEGLMQDVARAVREFFPPELFNRIDAVIPFRPLNEEVALGVTRKELAKMFARPGLVERNVFVQVSDAAVAAIARDALRAEDGARSLKRFIEDRIGTLLGEEIAKAPDAAFRVIRVLETGIESEMLVEARPAASRYALEPLWTRPLGELRARLPEALAILDRIETSDRLAILCEQLRYHLGEHNRGIRQHGELLYNIDWMRGTIDKLRDRIERFIVASRDLEHHRLESAIVDERLRFDFGRTGTWWDIFSCIAEAHVLERALDRVTDAGQHAVVVELLPYGNGSFVDEMVNAYSRARGEVVDVTRGPRGEVVMKIVGLCIKDYLELETGTHVWQPSTREPELVRVRVSSADAPPSNAKMGRLLPVVRTIKFDPPAPGKAATLLEMEDFVLGMPYATRVRTIAEAFTTLWLLRVSRVEG